MTPSALRDMLSSGDRRSIGRAEEVARAVAKKPELLPEIGDAMVNRDPIVRMRAADAVEKATRSRPELLADHKAKLFGPVLNVDQQEVQWRFLPMLSRLPLTACERRLAFAFAMRCLDSPSRIVAVEALTAMFALTRTDKAFKARTDQAVAYALNAPSASLRARARKLLSGR